MNLKGVLILTELLTLLGTLLARVALDFTNVTAPEHVRALEEFTITAFLAVPSTSTFHLKMNQYAMQGMSHLVNKSKHRSGEPGGTEVSMFNVMTDQQDLAFPSINESQLRAKLSSLDEEQFELMKQVFSGNYTETFTIAPSDSDFEQSLQVMYALRTRWSTDPAPDPEVDPLELEEVPIEVEQNLEAMTEGEAVAETGRAFHTTASPLHVAPEHLRHMMDTVFTVGRNHETDPLDKLSVVLYITQKFDSLGLMVVDHVFSAAEYIFWFDQPLQGVNIIGILAGETWGTADDKPVILGAHMDTVPGTPGFDDNGSGLAALVEAARVLATSGCSFRHSIIFVAFDLEELGTQGSTMFVKDYLTGSIMDKFGITEITGAFIVDCIANWDPTPGSQDFPPTWAAYLPDNARSIESHNYTGDFAGILYRSQVDGRLAYTLSRYYNDLGHDQYRLELMGLQELGAEMPNATILKNHFDFIRSDHVRFWYLNDTDDSPSMPAVLITDMGPYRGRMRQCYHLACDDAETGFSDLGLITKVTQTLVWTIADLAKGRCGPRGRLSVPTLFALMGSTSRQDLNQKMPIASIQDAMEILHFLGLLPPVDTQPT
ncbi:uncharacterized protein LOC119575271 [Penaeus monodon]|uniref:uncharacterized protein LOC119575271 n=1 Tax=Penaeus monodon TaxID=6687 RepID=UPI0018A7976E|nr:uncharacterized protein LOC119575271 [Penaeus monodon]